MLQSRKIKIKLNKSQKEFVHKNFGASRFIWNWELDILNKWWEKNKDLPKDKQSKRLSKFDLTNKLNKLKREDPNFFWLKDCDSRVQLYALDNLYKAFIKFWKKQSKYPKFKSKRDRKQSYSTQGINIPHLIDKNHLFLPKLKKVKFYNKGYIPNNVKLKQATISFDGLGYYCSVLFDQDIQALPKSNNKVGIDLGISNTVTCSNGTVYNWKVPKKIERRIKLSQRTLSRRKKASKRRLKAKQVLRKRYKHLKDKHLDFIHKMTSSIVSENQVIKMENLNTSGMMKNHHLSKKIQEQSFYEIRRQLEYKNKWYNRDFILVDRFYPSSQICSNCETRDKRMKDLKRRTFECSNCGLSLDRDLNAAKNILNYTTGGESESYAQGDLSSSKARSSSRRLANR